MAQTTADTLGHAQPSATDGGPGLLAGGGHRVVIRPSRGLGSLGLGDVWRYRELLFFIAWRDVKVRYKQTALGASWAVLQPALMMIVFTVFVGRFVPHPPNGVPYSVYTYAALIPWSPFAS